MLRFVSVCLALAILVTAAPVMARCYDPVNVDDGHSEYFKVYNVDSMSISFTPDATGTATTAIIGLQFCSRDDDVNSCLDLDFDTDGDGVGDTNLLTGLAVETSGVVGMEGFRWLRVFASVNPGGSDDAEFTICVTK